jgi:hypothetical protein
MLNVIIVIVIMLDATMLNVTDECRYADCHYAADCH